MSFDRCTETALLRSYHGSALLTLERIFDRSGEAREESFESTYLRLIVRERRTSAAGSSEGDSEFRLGKGIESTSFTYLSVIDVSSRNFLKYERIRVYVIYFSFELDAYSEIILEYP